MKPGTVKRGDWKQALKHVGENLYRSDATEIYYAIFKRNGKQIRLTLHTTDKDLARRRLEETRRKVGRLSTEDGRRLSFAEYDDAGVLVGGAAKHWFDFDTAGLEPSTRDRYLENIRNLAAFFRGKTIRAITLKLAEEWVTSRPPEACAASTFNKELEVLKRILKYALKHGYRLDNPAEDFKRRKPAKGPVLIPSRDDALAPIWWTLGVGKCVS